MKSFVAAAPIIDIALVVEVQSLNEEGQGTALRLIDITLPELFADLQELGCGRVFAHHQASQMIAHA